MKLTVTSSSYQPFAFGARSACAVIVGSVLSSETPAGSWALLPALSTAVPVTTWLAPSVVTTWSAVQLAIPESASWQSNLTVTSLLFQPFRFATGARTCEMVGGVLSMLTGTLWCVSTLPALSSLQNSRVCWPSDEI
ncbi:MAG: hypothetical protein AUG48_06085 [Actinobacteria bacterium 13_1_20CM_3_68_9]|nr:MAG: hypothetical protein AUG48_06085 [Actinobacteria bacterium 13_1_20CM_3_68_9]